VSALLAGQSIAKGTKRIYDREWALWEKFAQTRGLKSMPPSQSDLEKYICCDFAEKCAPLRVDVMQGPDSPTELVGIC
jgi:hypothetical protein